MTVSMPKELEEFVARKVQAGDFKNANEVICEAVRQLSQQQHDWEQDSPELREFLLEGMDGSHKPFRFGELKEMGERILTERKK